MFSTRAIFRFMRSYIWIIAILIGAVVYFMYKYLKGKSEIVTPPIPDIPNNGVNIPSGYLATATKLSEDLFTVTSGVFTWAAQKESVFVSLFNLTDDQLVYVYTVYNNKYFNSQNETMTKTIDSEWNYTLGGVKPRLVARLLSLGCS
ncbi:hypothetical protein MCERE19_01126 [Spirosomataceae bacterium]